MATIRRRRQCKKSFDFESDLKKWGVSSNNYIRVSCFLYLKVKRHPMVDAQSTENFLIEISLMRLQEMILLGVSLVLLISANCSLFF